MGTPDFLKIAVDKESKITVDVNSPPNTAHSDLCPLVLMSLCGSLPHGIIAGLCGQQNIANVMIYHHLYS